MLLLWQNLAVSLIEYITAFLIFIAIGAINDFVIVIITVIICAIL